MSSLQEEYEADMEHTRKRTFSLETDVPFLIEDIRISSVLGIIVAMIFAMVVAISFHTMNFIIHFRERHRLKRKSDCYFYLSTFYQMVSAFLAYVMVYCVMTYNVWLLVSVILGSGIGQLIIGPFISTRLEKSYMSTRAEDNELLTDLLPGGGDFDKCNNDADNDKTTDLHSEHDIEDSVLKPDSMQLELDDFLIHRPKHQGLESDNDVSAPLHMHDDDEKSEYDSLNGD